ncbi:MAG: hypothetical protein KME30_32005 [Iphinoe sp. HA4291-MV1]|jgi:hypothetical protein|nr:hypothetical protein [Iphinoe sp. HA4291-MV1]
MSQTSVQYFQPPAFEGMLATEATHVIRGASQELYNPTDSVIAFGSGVELKSGGQIVLPDTSTTAIYGVLFLNDQHGQDFRTVFLDNTDRPGYPGKSPVGVLTFGDIWVYTEEAVNDGDSVFVRKVAGTVPNNIVGRFRKTADGANTVAFAKARFISKTTSAGLVKINIGGF